MNIRSLFFSVIFTLTIIALFTGGAPAQDGRVLASAHKYSGDRFTYSSRTPNGAAVYSASRPSSKMLTAIDKGLTDLFAVARKNRYRKRLNYSDYSIYIGNADRTKNSANEYSPDIAIGTAQYAGSVYDQGGFMYVAGMVLATEPCSFLVAEHTKNFERVSEVVRYEGEHLVLYHNDRKRFNETADHSKGGGHPILQ